MKTDPRIEQASYLRNVALKHKPYRQPGVEWDHDHCAACWAKFAEWDGPDILHDGYATTAEYDKGEDYEWVCPTCFVELREQMGWRIVE